MEIMFSSIAAEDRVYVGSQISESNPHRAGSEFEFRLTTSLQDETHVLCNVYLLPKANCLALLIRDITAVKQHETT
jgi:hypothetical protein